VAEAAGPAPPQDGWRAEALRVFGTDDVDRIEELLLHAEAGLSNDELRARRAVLFRALAEDGIAPRGGPAEV